MFMKLSDLLKPSKIKVPHRKNTLEFETVVMPVPTKVRIGVQQHIGAPCSPIVKAGDDVKVGQVIADSEAFVSAPIHSSVSGKVEKVLPTEIIIAADGQQTIDSSITPPVIESDQDFVQAVKKSGLVGLGGAGFPTYIKLNFSKEDKSKIDTLLINAAECEPYITSDAREILENPYDVLDGVAAFSKHLEVKQAIIGIEDKNPTVILKLADILEKEKEKYKNISIKILPSQYPQGAEKILIESCTNRILPLGKLPSDVGIVVSNVSTVATFTRYLKTGIPLVARRITVDGSAVSEPKNVLVPIGTAAKDIIAFCGGYKEEPAKILQGGPMMGAALPTDEVAITKRTNSILAFGKKEAEQQEESDCIRCARCVDVCPMNLMPVTIDQNVRLNKVENLKNLNLAACIECGLCSFACPSNRYLVQNIRSGKAMLRDLGAKK